MSHQDNINVVLYRDFGLGVMSGRHGPIHLKEKVDAELNLFGDTQSEPFLRVNAAPERQRELNYRM